MKILNYFNIFILILFYMEVKRVFEIFEKRTEPIIFKLSPKERELVKEYCKNNKITVQQFMVECIRLWGQVVSWETVNKGE